jgi:hypothetical protein
LKDEKKETLTAVKTFMLQKLYAVTVAVILVQRYGIQIQNTAV